MGQPGTNIYFEDTRNALVLVISGHLIDSEGESHIPQYLESMFLLLMLSL